MNRSVKKRLKSAVSFIGVFAAQVVFAQPITPVAPTVELDKVIIFSRHNLRSPLTTAGSELRRVTPYQWTDWSVKNGHLTHKGSLLETYFGQYLNQWLTEQGLLDQASCESGEGIEVYANSLQRTIATGQAMISGAFAGCNVHLKHKLPIGSMDALFNPIIHSHDENFIHQALQKIPLSLTHKNLEQSYQLLSEVINFKQSEICIREKQCEFFHDLGELSLKPGKEPKVSGTMRLSKNIVDALLLQYYEGVPLNQIAGGKIDSAAKWQQLNKIKNDYQFMLRGDSFIAQHIGLPLLQYIQQDLNNYNKITILIGHDSNIIALLAALGVQDYHLPNQYEKTPIGGKIFIEIWKDKQTQAKKVKLEYVYQSTEQLRQLKPLNLQQPPMHQTLSLKQCQTDQYGLCDIADFRAILARAVNATQ